jgi:hyperosmotically inducible periplasmic protein
MNKLHSSTVSTALAAALGALALGACSPEPPSEPTVGQQVDKAIASVERKAEDVKGEAQQAAGATGQAMKDAAITAAVNAKLAGDKSLSAMRIDVDTREGRVTLNGDAPTGEARNRASALASSVEGVVSVDNRLAVQAKG